MTSAARPMARAPMRPRPRMSSRRSRRPGRGDRLQGADVADWAQAKAMIDEAVSTFGKLSTVLINNAGILRDRMLVKHDRGRVGRRDQGAPEGDLRPHPPRHRLLA